ncbi:MAG TPA: kelch repeat-containing protein [Patescibacteria group bacterium]
MKKLFLLFLLLLISCNSAQSRKLAQQNLAAYPWQFTAPMPHGRYGHDAVYAPNGKIYVMGGLVFKVAKDFKKDKKFNSWLVAKYNNGRYSNLAYDPKINQWEYMTSIPGRFSDYVTFYYPDEDRWSEKRGTVRYLTKAEKIKLCQPIEKGKKPTKIYETDLERQGNGVAIVLNRAGLIYWTGGQNFVGGAFDTVLPYNPTSDAWPNVSRKKIIKNDQDYIEGSGSPYSFKTIYETNIPPMQERRRDHRAIATSDGKLYVLGGFHDETATNKEGYLFRTGKDIVSKTMECYDPKTNKWEYKKPLSRERMDFAAVTGKDDKIYVFGGAAGLASDPQVPVLNTVEVYDPKTDTWSFKRPMPIKRTGHCAALAADSKIYIIGGSEVIDQPQSSVYIYDSEKDTWKKGPEMILPRSALAAAATPDGKIYAIGGTDVDVYEDKAQWQRLANLISADELGNYNGKVQDTVEVLDIYKWRKSKK